MPHGQGRRFHPGVMVAIEPFKKLISLASPRAGIIGPIQKMHQWVDKFQKARIGQQGPPAML